MQLQKKRSTLKILLTGICLVVLISFMLVPSSLMAQMKATVFGRVTDSQTGKYMPGANVMLEGTNYGSAADFNGLFRISNVPPGNYTLVVSYIGYDKYSEQINVAGGEIRHDISLVSSVVTGEAVTVYGLRQGQIKALSQQREAPNIKNVVDEEQMQRFPDVNSAEVLQRVSGVSVARDQGEGRYILIRGTSPRLNATTINGEKLASPEGGDRSVALDVISADQLASIEVTKAITPDMNGNAIGGEVNLRTKSAFDYPGKVFTATLGSGYNNLMGKPVYQGGLTYGNRFGADKNIGFMVSGSYQQSNRGSDNNEMEWGDVDVGDDELPWMLQNIETRDYAFTRTRMTLSSMFDYAVNENHRFYLNGLYSKYEDSESRRVLVADFEDFYTSATTVSEAEFASELRNRDQNQMIYNIAAGGEHQFNSFKLDYRFSYSYAEEEEGHHLEAEFEMDEVADLTLDTSDPDLPKWEHTSLADGYEYDADHFELDGIELHDNLTSDRDMVGGFNLSIPYALGANLGEFKFGGKAIMKEKKRDEDIREYGWEGDDDILMSQFTGNFKDDNYLNGNYNLPNAIDPDKMWDFVDENKGGLLEEEILYDDTYGATYDATEDVYAYYAMTRFNTGPMQLLGGFRHEFTKTKYNGHVVLSDEDGDYDEDGVTATSEENSYNNFLPMVHLRYKATPRTNFRAAFTTGIARPDYETLVPYRIINRDDEEMEIGNPDLVATTASNLDALFEHYFQGVGVLSGGVFYKNLNDIIYPTLYEMDGGEYDGFEVESWVQGEKATLWGFEVNWQQQLTFLPGFLSGLGIYFNYTHTESEATVGERKDVPLAGQSNDMANFALSYEKGGFTGRVSMNYHGKYLEELGEEKSEDIYYDDHIQWDFSASQTLFGGIQFYLQAINMNGSNLRYYMGRSRRPIQREFYSWWIHGGIKYIIQ